MGREATDWSECCRSPGCPPVVCVVATRSRGHGFGTHRGELVATRRSRCRRQSYASPDSVDGARHQQLDLCSVGFAVAAVVVVVVAKVHPLNVRFFRGDLQSVGGVNVNVTGRNVLWRHAWDAFLQSPVIGHGAGSADNLILALNVGASHPHNDYLRFLDDFGAIGFLLWILGTFAVLRHLWLGWRRSTSSEERQLYGTAFLGLFGLSCAMATDNAVIYLFVMAPLGACHGARHGLSTRPGGFPRQRSVSDTKGRAHDVRASRIVTGSGVLGGSRNAIVRAASANLLGSAVTLVGGFVVVVIASRKLGAGGAGALFEAIAVFTILSLVCQVGSSTASVRLFAQLPMVSRRGGARIAIIAMTGPLVIATVAGMALVSFSDSIALQLNGTSGGGLATYLRFAGVALPAATIGSIALGCLRGMGSRYAYPAVDSTVKPMMRVVAFLIVGWAYETSAQAWALAWFWSGHGVESISHCPIYPTGLACAAISRVQRTRVARILAIFRPARRLGPRPGGCPVDRRPNGGGNRRDCRHRHIHGRGSLHNGRRAGSCRCRIGGGAVSSGTVRAERNTYRDRGVCGVHICYRRARRPRIYLLSCVSSHDINDIWIRFSRGC